MTRTRPTLVVAGLTLGVLALAAIVVAISLVAAPGAVEPTLAVALSAAGGTLLPIAAALLAQGWPL